MPVEFKLPDLGEGIAEGEIVKWFVAPGDGIAEDQPLVEVMTDKVTVEIPSPVGGRVVEILAREGDVIPVGTPMVVLEDGAAAKAPAPAPAMEPAAVGAVREPPLQSVAGETTDGNGRVRAVPLVRRLARELSVDLATVTGTGPAGRITEADVRAAASRAPDAAPRAPERAVPAPANGAPTPSPREERLPFRGVRRRIAEKLVQCLQTTAQFTYVEEVDMTELVAVRQQALPQAGRRGVRLTYLPFVMKALVAALREHPALNATVDEERGEIVLKRYYNIGIATHTDEGLMVPVVREADRKSVWQLAEEIDSLVNKARGGSLALEDVQDGTFTVTSLGTLGGLMATPILNPPEVAILGVHQIRPRPVVRDGQVVARQIAHLSLTFDHRVIDGYVGAEFVRTLIRYLEHPGLLILVEET